MDKFQKIDTLLKEHGLFISELSGEIDALKKDDMYMQNEALRGQLQTVTRDLAHHTETMAALKAENARLKNELYQQLFNEKAKLIGLSNDKLSAYFSASAQGEENRLTQFESHIKRETDQLVKQLQDNRVQEENAAYKALGELKRNVYAAVSAARQDAERIKRDILSQTAEGIDSLRAEPLTEDQIVKRAKQNNIESFLGLKILNKLGLLLIVVGVIAAVQFTYAYIPDVLKGILAFALGIGMLITGELLNRRRPDVFSLGLTAGGIAVLYSATALSFFFLRILPMYPALGLCVLITAAAFLLSQRYDAQTIAAFAAVGGYLPVLSIAGSPLLVYYAIGYFILLAAFSLLVSAYKKWHVSQSIGFAMHIGSTCYILSLLSAAEGGGARFFAIFYVLLGFVLYNAIPIISSHRTGTKLKRPDNVLLIVNTVFSGAMIFGTFYRFGLWDRTGILAIALCAIYLITAKILQKAMEAETACRALFYITGLTYAVLAVPLQFDVAYLSLGWLLEGVFLLSYGIWSERKAFQRAGTIISALCLYTFLTLDLVLAGPLFFYKYLFLTLASVLVLSMLVLKNKTRTNIGLLFKCASVVNLWLFLLYTVFTKIHPALVTAAGEPWLGQYFAGMIAVTLSLCYAYAIARLKFIADSAVGGISMGIYALSILSTIFINTGNALVYTSGYTPGVVIIGTVLMVVLNLLAVFAVRDLALRLTLGKTLGVEWYPIILSAFFVFVVMQNLIVVFDLSLNSVIITAILAATALGWILFGFAKRYQYIRLSGLGLSFLTVIKLFIVDLSFLSAGMRIVSYFLLGIALLAISFVYQHFSRKLDAPKGGGTVSTL